MLDHDNPESELLAECANYVRAKAGGKEYYETGSDKPQTVPVQEAAKHYQRKPRREVKEYRIGDD